MKQYKYYAIRMQNTIIVRRTLLGLKQVTSKLHKPGTDFVLQQVTYTGGIVIGSMNYQDWVKHGGPTISTYKKIERTLARAMRPFLVGGEGHGSGYSE